MVFYMPGPVEEAAINSDAMTPRQIVEELDRNIVGQSAAKRAVAIALRNRIRRKKLDPAMAAEVMPKNILMIGTTGVGKTEIARRLARLAGSPFLKVEASKFTEVGYVGRDVESMVRDLVEIAIDMLRVEKAAQVQGPARVAAEARILDHLLPTRPRAGRSSDPEARAREAEEQASWERSRKTLKKSLEAGELEERMIEIQVQTQSSAGLKIFTPNGMEEMDMNLKEMMPGLFPDKKRPRKVSVAEAREILQRDEVDRLIDQDRITREAIERVESSGILFIDELDKVAGREGGHGPDISREGVQRDLLPIVEGTLVNTKYGMVKTEHILFIAAGAFHVSKPSDLIPELQGRFPIRVELDSLGTDDLYRILTEPESSLMKQYVALLQTEGVTLDFREEGLRAIAEIAEQVNQRTQNIGARRLHTVMERLLDEVSFQGAELDPKTVMIDREFVTSRLAGIVEDADLSRYIL